MSKSSIVVWLGGVDFADGLLACGSFNLVSSWLSLSTLLLLRNAYDDWPNGLLAESKAGNDSLRKLSENRSWVVMFWLNGFEVSKSWSLLLVLSFRGGGCGSFGGVTKGEEFFS